MRNNKNEDRQIKELDLSKLESHSNLVITKPVGGDESDYLQTFKHYRD